LTDEEKLNPLVSRFKAYIAKPTIANGFTFTKEVLDSSNMKLTIPSSPVVAGFIDCDDGSQIGGHEGDITKSKNGLRRTGKVQAIGFVEDKEPWWEEYKNEQWLTCFVDIWTDYFEGLQNLSERHIYQSMEIQMQTNKNNKIVTDCFLNALCMLENVQPAFDNSTFVEVNFSKVDFSNDVKLMKEQLVSINNGGDKSNMSKIKIEFAKDEIGSGDYEIKVDKSKDSVSNDSWGDIDKTALMHKVLKAKNAKSIVKDIYAEVDDGWEDKPSECLKYPIMQVKENNTAVYNSEALSSALAYANHPNTGNSDVVKKVKEVQKKLGFLKDDKTKKEGDNKKMSKTKMSKTQKEEFSAKFSMSANQIQDAMNDVCSSIKYDYENRQCTKYYVWDFDDSYMYGYDSQNDGNIAIPFTISVDGAIVADFENVKKAKNVSMWVVEESDDYNTAEDDDTYSMFAKSKVELSAKVTDMETKMSDCETKLADCETKLSDCNTKLTDTEAKLGKQFAETTSLETALADEKKISDNRQKEVDELSAKLKDKEDNEKLSSAKELMSKKEFSVLGEEDKKEILKLSVDKTAEEFETIAYAKLGKFASTNLEFDAENHKFSYMYIPNNQTPDNKKMDDDVYAEVRKKNGIEK